MRASCNMIEAMGIAIVAVATSSAQITITKGDINASLALGLSTTSRTDTATRTANIGTLGATSWNFSALVTNLTSVSMSVRPDTTPFSSFFGNATHALRVPVTGFGTLYAYYECATNLSLLGTGLSSSFQQRTRSVPSAVLYQLPLSFGSSWISTYAESSIVALPPPLPPQITITNYVVNYSVDAYGNLTLPGGAVYAALRVRTDRRSTSGTTTTRSITYSFVARNGASVTVLAGDTLQPNTGTIAVGSMSWTGPVSSDVPRSDAVPAKFALMQNYPNPFNPSTKIAFSIPVGTGHAPSLLKVYDVLGREVATLVNENLQPGSYEVTFDAEGLASGVYFYRLKAGEFVQTKRLLLMR